MSAEHSFGASDYANHEALLIYVVRVIRQYVILLNFAVQQVEIELIFKV